MAGDETDPVVDELYAGYVALGDVLVGRGFKDHSYEIGYLDGWADAMHHAAWAVENKLVTGRNVFPLFGNRKARRRARRELVAQRARVKRREG